MHLGQEKRKAANSILEDEDEELGAVAAVSAPEPVGSLKHFMEIPQQKPAWMDEQATATAKATMKLMEDRFQTIEGGQKEAALAQSRLELAVGRQAQDQARMQSVLDEVVRKQAAFEEGGSFGSASSSGSTRAPKPNLLASFAMAGPKPQHGANPYSSSSPAVDRSLIIIGGWRENSPREIIVNDMAKIIATYNLSGHVGVMAELKCPARAKFASFSFLENPSDGSAVKQAWGFTAWMRQLAKDAKPQCTGGSGSWSVINQSLDDRLKSRAIKKGFRALHLFREEAGVAAVVLDLGAEVPYVEGRFKGVRPGCFLGGIRVADYDDSQDCLQWNYTALLASTLAIEETALKAKMDSMADPS